MAPHKSEKRTPFPRNDSSSTREDAVANALRCAEIVADDASESEDGQTMCIDPGLWRDLKDAMDALAVLDARSKETK